MTFNELYRQLLIDIISNGSELIGRNGKTIQLPSYSFTINNMEDDHKLTIRKMYYKGVLGEFKTIINPELLHHVSQFEANGCNYWKEWADTNGKLFLDYHNMMHPQLEDIIQQIKNDPGSRRHVIELWNHSNLALLSLPCCWHGMTFTVQDDTLHLTWVQRSVDTAIGLPSDVHLAYLFMKHIADIASLKIGSCMFALSNVHIYEEHLEGVKEMISLRDEGYGKAIKFKIKA